MKRTQKPEIRELASSAAVEPREEPRRITLSIEELESRLAPQSTSTVLE